MQQDWLFALPKAEFDRQLAILDEWLAADPIAAAISDREAEEFVAAGFLLRFLDLNMCAKIWKVFGVRVYHTGEKAFRRATIMALRHWKEPKFRELLTFLVPNSGMGSLPDPAMNREVWTDDFFARAYASRVNILWLVQVRRYLGRAEELDGWLRSLGEWAEQDYRLWLNVGRITLSRIVYAGAAAQVRQEAAFSAQPALAEELRTKDRLSGTLRQDVRRLEQDRKRLKERARRAEREVRALLPQAQGEVEAARKALKERLAAQERELADQARRFAAELATLRGRLAGARTEFIRTLGDLAAYSQLDLLRGRSVTVVGAEADREIHRLLVESLGGSLAPEGGTVTMMAPPTLGALERQLRSLALERVLVKCDGLYRRKGGRPGVAMSGFQVHIGGKTVYRHSSTVCCGPLAGSLMAEYGAAAMALGWLLGVAPAPGAKLEIWSDCRTLVSRLNRRYPARRKLGCVMLDQTVRRLIRLLRERGCEVRFRWVPRERVHAVDRLCDQAYRELAWYHQPAGRPTASVKAFLRAAVQLAM